MDAIDKLGYEALPRFTPAGWGLAGWALGLVGVILMDERGFLPVHRLSPVGCGRGKSGCVLRNDGLPGEGCSAGT